MASEGLFIAGETNAESSGEAEFYCCLLVTRDRRGEAAVELFPTLHSHGLGIIQQP